MPLLSAVTSQSRPGAYVVESNPPRCAQNRSNVYRLEAVNQSPAVVGVDSSSITEAVQRLSSAGYSALLSRMQANYYSCGAYGTPISSTLGGPAPLGCVKGNYSPSVQGLYENLATNEIDHVAYIQAALGETVH